MTRPSFLEMNRRALLKSMVAFGGAATTGTLVGIEKALSLIHI